MSSSRQHSQMGTDLDRALGSSTPSSANSAIETTTAIDAMGSGVRFRGGEEGEGTTEQHTGLLDSEAGLAEYGSIASSSEF